MKAAEIHVIEAIVRGEWKPTTAAALTKPAADRLLKATLEVERIPDASGYRVTRYVRAGEPKS